MKASEAKKLLKCSYSSLHNYVRDGKIKVKKEKNRHPEYLNESVYEFAEKLNRIGNTENVTIYIHGRKYGFNLPVNTVSDLLDFIVKEMKKEDDSEISSTTDSRKRSF